MHKVFIQPIHYEQPSEQDRPNVRIRVKTTAQDEFTGEATLNPQYIDKLQRWVKKNKFTCVPLNNDQELELRVEIFKFALSRQAKDDVDTLKQDIAAMRKQNADLKGQQKLFRYYFLNIWREKQHKQALADKSELRSDLIQSTQAFFDTVTAQGVVIEEFGAKNYYLSFNQSSEAASGPNINQGYTPGMTPGNTPNGITPNGMLGFCGTPSGPMTNPSNEAIASLIAWCQDLQEQEMQQELTVFVCGGCMSYKKACLDVSKVQETSEGTLLVRVNLPVDMQSVYTVHVPKKLI